MVEDHIYIHENVEKLTASNQRLFVSNTNNTTSVKLHSLSETLNARILGIATYISESKSTQGIIQFSNDLDEKINSYNLHFAELNMPEITKIQVQPLKRLNEVNTEVAMKVLVRTQEQLAVNEYCYLTNLLAHK